MERKSIDGDEDSFWELETSAPRLANVNFRLILLTNAVTALIEVQKHSSVAQKDLDAPSKQKN